MPHATSEIPSDYPARVKFVRSRLELTQVQLAERIGVSFATVNRWENGQSRPTRLAWQQIIDLETAAAPPPHTGQAADGPPKTTSTLDFAADPAVVAAVAEAKRLAYGHLFNGAFATEISLIDPLPHQRIAVYEHMLGLSPLRFLLADDAGAGKTIMTGLYLREVLARRLIRRVLVVPPAGLVGNWEREMRTLFRLPFRIVHGADARSGNPFSGPDSDRLIVSLDTLAGERMFARLHEAVASGAARPYDLVVFDEAHKLAADRDRDFYVRKTDRYCLAEALAGVTPDDPRWQLGWSAANILLLTASPHMGRDFPYYCLWRLLVPDALPTFDAFQAFPEAQRRRHFIRRIKEELVRFDGRPLYPQRQCDTVGYPLSPEERDLYEATTRYIDETYNQARILNRSAARLAMSVFQRRQASSTYALMRSFERRLARLDEAIELVRSGRGAELERRQRGIAAKPDLFESLTADEDADENGERHEEFEEDALGGVIAVTLMDLNAERARVEGLLSHARRLAEAGEDSKFEKLRTVLRDPAFASEKFIIFTEHRDTAEFLVRRLEGLGFTGQVALIHGGLDYREREAQVEQFRRPLADGGANYLVATDAAGEGINRQFCWLMVNYDVPWNPARLEQRMGRIHRHGQKRDPVVIVNLTATDTREGRVLKVLLDKLEAIRRELRSDKVFDVVGRLFQNLSLSQYLLNATTEEGELAAINGIEGLLTVEQARAQQERERALFGGGDVKSHLPALRTALEQEQYRRLLPGYVRHFVETAAPLVDLKVEGDAGQIFDLAPQRPRGLDPMLAGIEFYPGEMRGRFTVYRPEDPSTAIWLHPGEPVFDQFCEALLSRRRVEARRGAIFIDPDAKEPYLFHLTEVSVLRRQPAAETPGLLPLDVVEVGGLEPGIVETRLIGLRQGSDGSITPCPLEHLLLLRGARAAPGSVPLARLARALVEAAEGWLRDDTLPRMIEEHRAQIARVVPERVDWVARGYDYKTAELIAARRQANEGAQRGDARAAAELARIKEQQRRLTAEKEHRLAQLRAEPSLIVPGDAIMLAHALVLPTDDPEERQRHDAETEAIAMQLARAHEEAAGASVHDVSRPELARRAGLTDWPGFDLRSLRPASAHGPAEERAIEVKGRAGSGAVEVLANEWAKACNVRERYWLYVVFDCATPQPRLIKVQDPFGRLLATAKGSMLITATEILAAADAEHA
jgi:superfamily II DNA or RNA helicase/DNA-binding XRE family transcriptional regulator